MAQSKILLDSNSYFRLAKSIHPLLFQPFGSSNYCLYVLPELEHEYDRQPRLHSKFPWVSDPEYKSNRCRNISLSRKQRRELEIAIGVVWDYSTSEMPGPSRVDVTVLSYGYVLGIPIVTDDLDLKKLSSEFSVIAWSTLELLKLMLDCDYIDQGRVRATVGYWRYIDDPPANLGAEYGSLFGESLPD